MSKPFNHFFLFLKYHSRNISFVNPLYWLMPKKSGERQQKSDYKNDNEKDESQQQPEDPREQPEDLVEELGDDPLPPGTDPKDPLPPGPDPKG